MTTTALEKQNSTAIAEQPINGNRSMIPSVGMQAPLTMNELKFYGSMIHEAGLIPKTNNETPKQLEARAMAKVIAGHAYGFDPILSMRLFDVINGKLQPTSECVSVLIKRSGRYNYKVVTWDAQICDLLFVGKATDGTWKPLGHSIFTLDDAKKAGYLTGQNKNNWEKIPRNMLLARAITNGKRLYCADVMDPGGYFSSGNDIAESPEVPSDLDYVDALPDHVDPAIHEKPVEGEIVSEDDRQRADAIEAIDNLLGVKFQGDEAEIVKFMEGRDLVSMTAEDLIKLQGDLAAL